MSTGGVFQLITNTGVQDALLMNIDGLRKRIKELAKARVEALRKKFPGKSDKYLMDNYETDWMPTLSAIDKSHIVFVNSTFKPFVSIAREYYKNQGTGVAKLGNSYDFRLDTKGEFTNDMVMRIKLSNFAAVSASDKVRYFEFLGHRLMKKVEFIIQQMSFDSYGSDEMNAYYQFKVPANKEKGYLRCIGQEVPKLGYLTADPTVDEVREYRWFGDGAQTFKQTQDDIELWIPILFWFKDPQCSLPNFALPKRQAIVRVTFEEESKLVAYANYGGGGSYTVPQIDSCELYVNHIFLLPDIHQLFKKHFGFQLIRVHRKHVQPSITESSGSIKLADIKWPVESLYVQFRPTTNLTSSNKWHRGTSITDTNVKEAVVTGVSTIQVNNAVYLDEAHVVSKLGLDANDIPIYQSSAPEFYNNYLPYRYGQNITTPHQLGWYMMNFNLYPNEYQPSGHFNISLARELYLNYISAVDGSGNNIIRAANPVDVTVLADVINFFIVKQGSATLRFAT